MPPRDLKRYQDYLKEPQQYGEAQLRGGAQAWLRRNARTAAAFQAALAAGCSVAEAERLVLQEAKAWHPDISQGDIAAIPLQTQVRARNTHTHTHTKRTRFGTLSKWFPFVFFLLLIALFVPLVQTSPPTAELTCLLHLRFACLRARQVVQFDARAPETSVLPLAPLAPSLPAPRVLDSPRTQADGVQAANQLLFAASGALPFKPNLEILDNGNNGNNRNHGGGSGVRVLQLTDGSDWSAASSSSSSTGGGGGEAAAPPGARAVALSGGKGGHARSVGAPAVYDKLGLVLDEQLPGLRSEAAYPWQVLWGTHPETGREQVHRRRRSRNNNNNNTNSK